MLAFYDTMPDARAVAWLATGLEGAAGDWFDQLATAHATPPSPEALFDGLRRRFEAVNVAETARWSLDALHQEKGTTVNEYTSRFLQLVAHLPKLDTGSRIFQYRRGLNAIIEDRITQAEPQPATLEATIALAARIEGRAGSRTAAGESLAAASTSTPHSGCVPDTTTAGLMSRITELEAIVRAQASHSSGGREESRRQVPGLSPDEARRRMDAGLCLHCSRSGHIVRWCPDRAQSKPPTLTA